MKARQIKRRAYAHHKQAILPRKLTRRLAGEAVIKAMEKFSEAMRKAICLMVQDFIPLLRAVQWPHGTAQGGLSTANAPKAHPLNPEAL